MTTTERRLAITPGDWTAQNILGTTRVGDNPKVVGPDGGLIVQLGGGELDEVEANAELIADAGTTANACDMLPSELLALAQSLCSALEGTKSNPSWWREHPSESWIQDAMESAKELGIVPKK